MNGHSIATQLLQETTWFLAAALLYSVLYIKVGSPLHVVSVTTYLSQYCHLFCPRKKLLQVSDWIHFLLVKCHLKAPQLMSATFCGMIEADVTDAVIFFKQVKYFKAPSVLAFQCEARQVPVVWSSGSQAPMQTRQGERCYHSESVVAL